MGRFEKHIGKGEEVEIEGEKFLIKPLTTDDLPDFFKIMKSFSGANKDEASNEDVLKNISDDGLASVRKVIDKTLTISFPEEPEADRKAFGLKHMGVLLGKIMELNFSMAETKLDRNQRSMIEKMRERSAAKQE